MKLTRLFWDLHGRWSLASNYGNVRVKAGNWFGSMTHMDKVDAVNSFHSAVHSSDDPTTSKTDL